MNITSQQILAMNIKYYRARYGLSQEKFAEKVGSNLTYINQIENCKRNISLEMLDKIVNKMNKNIDSKLKMTSSKLLEYDSSHKTNFKRVDEKR